MPELKCQSCDACGSAGKGQEWISVEEKLPSEGYAIIAWDKPYPRVSLGWIFQTHPIVKASVLNSRNTNPLYVDVTHWMPLPESPEISRVNGLKELESEVSSLARAITSLTAMVLDLRESIRNLRMGSTKET